jgi:hypothetical protein
MGQARWACPRTARKSPALERPGTKGVVHRAGPARWSDRAWAAPSARWPGMGHDTIFGPARCQPVKIIPLRIKSTNPKFFSISLSYHTSAASSSSQSPHGLTSHHCRQSLQPSIAGGLSLPPPSIGRLLHPPPPWPYARAHAPPQTARDLRRGQAPLQPGGICAAARRRDRSCATGDPSLPPSSIEQPSLLGSSSVAAPATTAMVARPWPRAPPRQRLAADAAMGATRRHRRSPAGSAPPQADRSYASGSCAVQQGRPRRA